MLTATSATCVFFIGQGIINRDEIVFREVRERRINILMVTSGGYQMETSRVIGESILNLNVKGLLTPPSGNPPPLDPPTSGTGLTRRKLTAKL